MTDIRDETSFESFASMKRIPSIPVILKLVSLTIVIASWHQCQPAPAADVSPVIELGSRRELFIDKHLIARLDKVRLHLHEPRNERR